MDIEQVIKKSFNFRLKNNVGSFTLDEDEVKRVVLFDEALTVSDSNNSDKKYLILRSARFDHWLVSKLENLFKNTDSIEDLEEIIKDFAEAFGSHSSENFIKSLCKEPNKKFLEFILFKTLFDVYVNEDVIIEEMFNFNSDDETIRSKANNRMKKYFDLNFIEEFTFGYKDVDYRLFVFEVWNVFCRW